jgi:hypothetical protein
MDGSSTLNPAQGAGQLFFADFAKFSSLVRPGDSALSKLKGDWSQRITLLPSISVSSGIK